MKQTLPSILFVDDEPEIRFELKRFLQRYSSEVVVANNGEEGLALFKKHTPDIVISDIKMPKMSGIEMAKKIKKHSPKQVIIFTTAHSDNGYFLEAIEMQVDGYILKPVDLGLLKQKINEITRHIKLEKEKKLYESIVEDIAQMQENMLAVYNENGSPIFCNEKLLTFFGYKSMQEFLKQEKDISHRFEACEEYYSPSKESDQTWIEALKKMKEDERIVYIRGDGMTEPNFFLVSLSDKTDHHYTIVTFSEITSIVEEKRQYRHGAYTDVLTQIDNRARFNIVFNEAMKQSKKDNSPLSIILLDIDNFKDINDVYGHQMGDKILKEFANFILKNIRFKDFFARWGGEEFVLLLSNTPLKSAKAIAENLRMLVQNHDFGVEKNITCSFGVASNSNSDTEESLFERADKALYKAKNNGRNKVVMH